MANENFALLISAIIDKAKSMKDVESDLSYMQKQLQEKYKIKFGVELDNKTAKSAVLQQQKLADSMKIVSDRAKGAEGNFNAYIKSLNSKAVKNYSSDINKISDAFKQAQLGGDKFSLQSANAQATAFKGTMKDLGMETKSLTQILGNDIQKFAQWTISATVLMQSLNTVKGMVSTIYELDTALTDLRMVTGDSVENTQKLIMSYSQLAQNVGSTTTEVAKSANEWLRQGKTVEETNTLIYNSMVLSKIGQLESADATQFLTSAMKGYKTEVSDTLGIVDQLSAVDIVSATSAGGLAEAMSRTASSADIAGVSMQKLIGYLAVVGEVTQKEMSSVGESFKTIFSRMGNVKLGSFIDEDGTDITNEINDVEKVLNKVNIKLRDSATEFRDFDKVLDDVGNNWDSFNEVEQSAIATTFAGVRQRENFLVLMENYGKSLEYAKVASESSGTAMKKFEMYQESLDAKIKELTSSFEELSLTILNSDMFKGILDGSIALTNGLTGIFDTLGTLPTLIASVTLAFNLMGKQVGAFKSTSTTLSLFGKNIVDVGNAVNKMNYALTPSVSNFTKLNNAFSAYNSNLSKTNQQQSSYINAIGQQNSSLGKYLSTLNGAQASMSGYVGSLVRAKVATIGLQLASTALNVALTMGISLAIQGIVSAISSMVNAQKEALETSNELTDAYKTEKDSLDSQTESYKNLKKQLDNSNLSTDEARSIKEQLIGIQDTLIDSYGAEASNIDLVNGKYREQLGWLDKLSKKKARDYVAENKSGYEADKKYLSEKDDYTASGFSGLSLDKDLQDYLKQYKDIQTRIMGGRNGETFMQGNIEITLDDMSAEKAYNTLTQLYADIDEKFGNGKDAEALKLSISNTLNTEFDKTEIEDAKTRVEEYTKAQIIANDQLRPLYQQSAQAIEDYNNALVSGKGVDEAKKNLEGIKKEVYANTDAVSGSKSIFDNLFSSISTDTAKVATSAEKASDTIKSSFDFSSNKESIDTFQSSISTLGDALEKINSGKMTDSEIVDLIQQFPELAGQTDNLSSAIKGLIDDSLGVLTETLKDVEGGDIIIALLTEMANLASGASTSILSLDEALSKMSASDTALTSLKDEVSELKLISIDTINSLMASYPELTDLLYDYLSGVASTGDVINALSDVYKNDTNNWEKALLTKYKDNVEFLNKVGGNTAELNNKLLDMYGIDISNDKTYYQKKMKILASFLSGAARNWQKYFNTTTMSTQGLDDSVLSDNERKYLSEQASKANQVITDYDDSLNFSGIESTFKKSNTNADKSKSKKDKDNKETINWVERKLSVLASKLEVVKKKASDVLSTFKQQNTELDKANKILKTQISIQEKSYSAYMKQANKVGLSASLKKKVKNGSMDITQYSSTTAKKIKEYQDWYDKAQEVKGAITDLKLEEKALIEQSISNITDDYDKLNSYQDALSSKREAEISRKEAKGGTGLKSDYNYLIDRQKESKKNLRAEIKEINKILASGKVVKGSEEWLGYKEQLKNIQTEIVNCDTAIIELNNNIIDLGWDKIDKGIEKFDKLKDKIDVLASQIDDDELFNLDSDGNIKEISDKGIAKLTLFQSAIQASKEKIKALKSAIESLNKQYKNDKNNTKYTERLEALESQLIDTTTSMNSYTDSISDMMDSKKDVEIDLINDKISKYKDLIDARKKALRELEDAHDYENKLSESTSEIDDIEKRIAELSSAVNSDDREAIAELKKANDELAKKKKDLAETQHDHEVELAENALDKSAEEYEDSMNVKIDLINSYYDTEAERIKMAADLTKNSFTEAWNAIAEIAKANNIEITNDLNSLLVSTLSSITNLSSAHASNETKLANLPKASTSNTKKISSIVGTVVDGAGGFLINMMKSLSSKGFSNGGTIGSTSGSSSILKLLESSTGDNALIPVKTGEGVLTNAQNKAWLELVPNMIEVSNMFGKISDISIPNFANKSTSTPIENNTYLTITGDASELTVQQLKKYGTEITEIVSKNLVKFNK